jgi:hypothetical protein
LRVLRFFYDVLIVVSEQLRAVTFRFSLFVCQLDARPIWIVAHSEWIKRAALETASNHIGSSTA